MYIYSRIKRVWCSGLNLGKIDASPSNSAQYFGHYPNYGGAFLFPLAEHQKDIALTKVPCESRERIARTIDFDGDAAIPEEILRWSISNNKSNLLRTFIYLKYVCKVAGDGRSEINYESTAKGLDCSIICVRNHVQELTDLKLINHTKKKRQFYCRSWERVESILGIGAEVGGSSPVGAKKSKKKVCIMPVSSVGDRNGFKALVLSHFLSANLKSQELAVKLSAKNPKIGGDHPGRGLLSAMAFGNMFGFTEMGGSKLRRLVVDYGLAFMLYVYSPTPYQRWDVDLLRQLNPSGEEVRRLVKSGSKVLRQECSELVSLNETTKLRRRRA